MKYLSFYISVAFALVACGEATTGKRVVLNTQVVPATEAQTGFKTFSGWNVVLNQALISSGPLYYFDGSPAFVMRSSRSPWRQLQEAILPKAYAHPGHYAEGVAKGQMLMESSIDLLAGPVTLPAGNGVTGLYRSATFAFAPPIAGPAVARLEGHAALLQGLATKDERAVNFRIVVDFAEIDAHARNALIQGCTFEEATVEGDGVVTVTIKPHVWFNLVDFTGAAPGSPEAPTDIAKGTTAHIALVQGLAQFSAYHFSYTASRMP